MLKLLLKITCIAAMIANNTGSEYLCSVELAKGYALRPMAVKSASAGDQEVEPYNLVPLDDDRSSQERDDDYDLLMWALSPSEGKKPVEETEASAVFDAKMAKRHAQRENASAEGTKQERINSDATEEKLTQKEDNDQFMNFWAQQADAGVVPSAAMQDPFQRALAAGEGAQLGDPEHLSDYIEVEAARGEVASELGVSTTSKIAKVRMALAEIDDPDTLFIKATGYLFYAAQIGCDRDRIEDLRGLVAVNKDDGDRLKLIISKILELIEGKVRMREKIEKIRKQLPGVHSPAEIFEKASSYLSYLHQRGYNEAEIVRLRHEISSNQGKLEQLRKITLEILTLLEMQEESRTIPLVPERPGPPEEYRYPEVTVDEDMPFQIRRARAALDNFKKRWMGKLLTTTSRTSKVPVTLLPLLLKQARQLTAGVKAADFYDEAFRNLTLFDIIQLDEQGGRQYIIVGTTHRGEFEYILKPLLVSGRISEGRTRLTNGYDGRIRAFRVKGFEGVSVLREHLDFTIEPPRPIGPDSLNVSVRIDAAA